MGNENIKSLESTQKVQNCSLLQKAKEEVVRHIRQDKGTKLYGVLLPLWPFAANMHGNCSRV